MIGWLRRLTGRDEQQQRGLSPSQLAEALTRWREGNEYAWWLNDSLDIVSRTVQQQVGLIRETRVAVAVKQKSDVREADRARLIEGFDKLLAILDATSEGPPPDRELWPGHSCRQFREAVDSLREGALKAKAGFSAGMVASAHEGFKDAVEDWLFASVPLRYRLNSYMRESLPSEVLASLPSAMLPAKPPKELVRYAGDVNA